MSTEKPSEGRSIIEKTPDGLRVVIPVKKGAVLSLLLTFTFIWFLLEVGYINELINSGLLLDSRIFSMFWLLGWTAIGVYFGILTIWSVGGREIITFSSNSLLIEKRVINLGTKKQYSINDIKNLRIYSSGLSPFPMDRMREFVDKELGGKLSFDYGIGTIRFASGINEVDAKYLLDELNSRGLPVGKT